MPKFKFQAIDNSGRLVRGIMRADDEGSAREVIEGTGCFVKRIEQVAEDAAVTWTARKRSVELDAEARQAVRDRIASDDRPKVSHTMPQARARLDAGDGISDGVLALEGIHRVLFAPQTGLPATIVLTRDDVENAWMTGLMPRRLAVAKLTGELLIFESGKMLPSGVLKRARNILRPGKGK